MRLEQLHPRGDLLVIRPLVLREYKAGSHVVPATVASWIPPTQGEVIACGPAVELTRPGSRVLFGVGVGQEVPLSDGTTVRILRQADIICEMD